MNDWITIGTAEDIAPESFKLIELDDIEVMVFNLDGQFYAIEDQCTHDGGPLSDGDIEGCEIICPRHAARFDIRNGKVTAPPAYEDLHTFPLRIEQGMLQIRDNRWD